MVAYRDVTLVEWDRNPPITPRGNMLKRLKTLFDKYIMAAAYGEAGIPHMAKEILND